MRNDLDLKIWRSFLWLMFLVGMGVTMAILAGGCAIKITPLVTQ